MTARIYKPSKNAMQSGQGRSKEWIFEYEPSARREIDPLMGWTSSSDTQSQVRMTFDTLDAAKAYAKEHGIEVVQFAPHKRKPNIRPRGYA
jgi:NADH dehydrogenase